MGSVTMAVAAGMGLFLLLHLAVWRFFPSDSPRISLLSLLWGVGTGLSLFVSPASVTMNRLDLCAVLWIDFSFLIFYLFFYAGIARSVSVTLLVRLLEIGGRPLDFDRVVEEYAGSSRFEDRILLMSQSGLLQLSGPQVRLTGKGYLLGLVAQRCGRFLGEGLKG